MNDSMAVRTTRASSGAGKKGGLKSRKTMDSDVAGAADEEDPHAVRCQWRTAELSIIRWASQRDRLCAAAAG